MLDVGFGEILILAAAALFIFGPDKLPKLAADAARTFRTLRQMIASARRDLTDQLGPEFEGINLDDLNPRTFVRKQLLDDLDEDLDDQPTADETRTSGKTAAGWVPPEARGAGASRANGQPGSSSGNGQPTGSAAPAGRGELPGDRGADAVTTNGVPSNSVAANAVPPAGVPPNGGRAADTGIVTPRRSNPGRAGAGRRPNGGRHTPRHAAPLREGERPPYDADAT